MQALVSHLVQCVAAQAPAAANEWLRTQVTRAAEKRSGVSDAGFETAFAGAGRRLGHGLLELGNDELDACVALLAGTVLGAQLPPQAEPEVKQLFSRVSPAMLGRIALLVAACESLASEQQSELVGKLFYTGDVSEREAVLRGLCLLPEPQRFVDLGVDACRTNVQSVFEAIACENPFAARFFTDAAFNQMVIKCFFTEVALVRVSGLPLRVNDELSRMADNYASERRAAGRSVPADLHMARAAQLKARNL